MNVTPLTIYDVKLLEPQVHGDHRGFFMETFRQDVFSRECGDYAFVQDNHSRSQAGTLRGLHYQLQHAQGKLVRVTRGEVFDVAVDLRKNSPTLGQWVGEWLSEQNKRMLWVPPGFAHGFYVPTGEAEFQYKCTDYYAPADEHCIRWDDPDLGIEWPLGGIAPVVSGKDEAGGWFKEAALFD